MNSLATCTKSEIETMEESKTKLSRPQIVFILTLPLLFIMTGLISILTTSALGPSISINPILSTLVGFIIGVLVFIIFIPLVLKMPNGKTTIHQYLKDIGVNRIRPLSRTLLIYFPCLLSIIAAQIAGSLVYNFLFLGWNFQVFSAQLFDLTRIHSWIGWGPITAIGSIFEEIVLRGVVLTILLKVYSERKSIIISAIAFGYVHIINLLNGMTYTNLIFVSGQMIWATIIGVLYGYMFIKTGNLYANMLLHWTANGIGNCFMFLPLVTPEIHAVLNIVFNIGLMSTIVSILWVAIVSKKWPLSENKASKLLDYQADSTGQLIE